MTENTKKIARKRLPQGWRKHIRRLKQAARKEGIPFRRSGYVRTPAKADPEPPKSTAESTTTKEAD